MTVGPASIRLRAPQAGCVVAGHTRRPPSEDIPGPPATGHARPGWGCGARPAIRAARCSDRSGCNAPPTQQVPSSWPALLPTVVGAVRTVPPVAQIVAGGGFVNEAVTLRRRQQRQLAQQRRSGKRWPGTTPLTVHDKGGEVHAATAGARACQRACAAMKVAPCCRAPWWRYRPRDSGSYLTGRRCAAPLCRRAIEHL